MILEEREGFGRENNKKRWKGLKEKIEIIKIEVEKEVEKKMEL